jgi:hypothetical protein
LFTASSAIFHLYHAMNTLLFNVVMMRSAFTLSEVLACNDVVSESMSFLCLKITWRLMASKSYLPYIYKSALYPGCIFDSSHTINRCTFGTISETGATIFVRHYFISRCHMSPGILNINIITG